MIFSFRSKNTKVQNGVTKRFWSSETGHSYLATNAGITKYISDLEEWSFNYLNKSKIRAFTTDFLSSGKLIGSYAILKNGFECCDTLEIAGKHPKGMRLDEITYEGEYST